MLINCVAYQDGKKLADIPVGQIHLYVSEPGCFVWVALKDPEPPELEAMQKEFGLHDLAIEDAQHGHQRPKIEEYALVAVPTLIAGIYGMNFEHMPEIQWQHGYPVSLISMAVIDLYLFYRFRKAKWL